MTKGTYHSFDQMWKGLRTETLKMQLDKDQTAKVFNQLIPVVTGFKKDVEDSLKIK